MTALVGHTVEVGEHVPGHIVGGDAHIPTPEFGGEGVLALGQQTVLRLEAPQLHDFFRDLLLGVQRPVLVEKIGADGGAVVPDGRQQRHNGGPQRGEEFVALGDGQATLVPVQPDLVGVAVGGKVPGLGPAGRHDLFQIGRKQRKIVGALGFRPHRDALLHQLGEGRVLGGGNFRDLVVLPLQLPHLGGLLVVLGVGCRLPQQRGGVLVHQQIKTGPAQHLAGLRPAVGAPLRGHRLGVKVHHVQRIPVGIQLLFQRPQAHNRVFHGMYLVLCKIVLLSAILPQYGNIFHCHGGEFMVL